MSIGGNICGGNVGGGTVGGGTVGGGTVGGGTVGGGNDAVPSHRLIPINVIPLVLNMINFEKVTWTDCPFSHTKYLRSLRR